MSNCVHFQKLSMALFFPLTLTHLQVLSNIVLACRHTLRQSEGLHWICSLAPSRRWLSPTLDSGNVLRVKLGRKEKKKKSASQSHLKRRKVDLNEVTCQTDRSALCRQQGSLLSLTQWTEAGRDTGQCWDLAPCYGSSAGTQSCV